MARPYAGTKVTVGKSRAAITALLEKWGVEDVQWTQRGHKSMLRFIFVHNEESYTVRLVVDPEAMGDRYVEYEPRVTRERHYEREAMRLHRVMYFAVKSKIECIEAGLEEPRQVWMYALETTNGTTVYQELEKNLHQLQEAKPNGLLALPGVKS